MATQGKRDAVVTVFTSVCAHMLLSGCSVLFETSAGDLDAGQEVVDDAAPSLEAGEVFEGTGAVPVGDATTAQRPHILVVRGNFKQDSVLTLGGGGPVELGETVVSTNGLIAATTLRVPVMFDLGQGEELSFEIEATNGEVESPTELVVLGLDELQPTAAIDSAELQDRYSSIELVGTRFSGDGPIKLVSMSSIKVGGLLSVSAAGPEPGPGGCPGGVPGASADCGASSGGRGGLTNGGGGGGSHGELGTAGIRSGVNDMTFGQPGELGGSAMLVPLADEGGAGGGGSGGANGASGGGGGGVLELHAEGPIILEGGALLTAVGGNGGSATCGSNEGGGGGGAGGAIFVRSHTSLDNRTGEFDLVLAGGGAGGGDDLCVGGNGGAGRIRIDPPEASVLGSGSEYGAMWSPTAPTIVRTPTVDLELWGGTGRTLGVSVNQGAIRSVTISGGIVINSTQVSATLEAGLNEICVTPSPASPITVDEAWNCISIAYVP